MPFRRNNGEKKEWRFMILWFLFQVRNLLIKNILNYIRNYIKIVIKFNIIPQTGCYFSLSTRRKYILRKCQVRQMGGRPLLRGWRFNFLYQGSIIRRLVWDTFQPRMAKLLCRWHRFPVNRRCFTRTKPANLCLASSKASRIWPNLDWASARRAHFGFTRRSA